MVNRISFSMEEEMKLFKTSTTLPKGRQKINKKKLLEAAEKVGKILKKERKK